jgi:threonine/homoserine/homoserine lactone efflux protein
MLIGYFLKGIVVGLLIAVPVGPVGVLCVRRTIFGGRTFGLVSGLGSATADAFFGVVAGFGLTVVSNWLFLYEDWLRLAGGLFLVGIGVSALRKKVVGAAAAKPERNAENLTAAFMSTFALTITNPVTILAFVGVFAAIGFTNRSATLSHALVLVAGVTLGSMLWWLGISLGANRFRRSFSDNTLVWLNRISGAILVASGIGLLASLAVDRFA